MSKGRVWLCIGTILLFSSFDYNPEAAAYEYIESYKDLAIVEMYRSGIPASITLAQGLHESNYGTSKLATEANNHFGIKCKSYWTGKTYYHKDDDLNKKGELMESCFRAYDSDIDSYIDRSNFLMQNALGGICPAGASQFGRFAQHDGALLDRDIGHCDGFQPCLGEQGLGQHHAFAVAYGVIGVRLQLFAENWP